MKSDREHMLCRVLGKWNAFKTQRLKTETLNFTKLQALTDMSGEVHTMQPPIFLCVIDLVTDMKLK